MAFLGADCGDVPKPAIPGHALECKEQAPPEARPPQKDRAIRRLERLSNRPAPRAGNRTHIPVARFRKTNREPVSAATPSRAKRPNPIRRPSRSRKGRAK